MYCLSFLSRGRWLPLLSALCALFFLGPNSGVVEEANAQYYYGWPGRYWGRGRYGYGWGGYNPYVSYYYPYYGYGGYGYGWGNSYWSPYSSTYPYYGTFRYLRHLENKQKRSNNDNNRDLGKAKSVAANGAVPLPDVFFEGDAENSEGPQPFSDEFIDSEEGPVLVSPPVVGKANRGDSETEAESGTETSTPSPLSSDEEEEGVAATSSASPDLEDATATSTQEPSFLETTTSTTVAPVSSSEGLSEE